MKKIIGVIVIVVIAFLLFGKENGVHDELAAPFEDGVVLSEVSDEQKDVVVSEAGDIGDEGVVLSEIQSEVKEFTVTGTPFEFSMKEIRVAKGDTVRIVFKNGGGTHDWKIDEFNAATNVIKTGEEDVIEFIADKSGTFEYYCSVGNHRAQGMVGNLIVE